MLLHAPRTSTASLWRIYHRTDAPWGSAALRTELQRSGIRCASDRRICKWYQGNNTLLGTVHHCRTPCSSGGEWERVERSGRAVLVA
jgi:hypothetical protein